MLKSALNIIGLLILSSLFCLMAGSAGAVDNAATMGSYADGFPSLRIWRSGNAYDDKGDFIAGTPFWGKNMARTAAGAAHEQSNGVMKFDSLKIVASSYGRTLITEVYTDYHFYVECGDARTDDTTFEDVNGWLNVIPYNYYAVSDSLGLTWNDLFFQLADDSDSVVYASRATSCSDASDLDRKWANADLTAAQKRQSQFGIYNGPADDNYPATDAYFMDYTDTINYSLMKVLAYKRVKDRSLLFLGLDSVVDGYTFDNSAYGSQRSTKYVHSTGDGLYWYSFGGNTGGAAWETGTTYIDWVGWDSPFVLLSASSETLWNRWCAGFNAMADSMKDWGISRSANYVNTSPIRMDDYANRHSEPVVTLFFELRGVDMLIKDYATITNATSVNAELSRVDSAILYNIPHVNEFRVYASLNPDDNDTGPSYFAHTYLCAHLTYQDTALTYFCYQNDENGSAADGDSMYLANWDLFRRYYGNVLNTRQYISTGTTVDGDPVHVFWREYDSAFVYWFPPDDLADDSALTNYVEIDCGEPIYELGRTDPGHCDSTYRADGIIQISPRRGVVAWKAAAGGSSAATVIQGVYVKGAGQ